MSNTILPQPSTSQPSHRTFASDSPPVIEERRRRFELLFRRSPTAAELDRFNRSHDWLLLRMPARARRRAARLIVSC